MRYLVLGEVGAGKSTFINYLVNYFEGEKDFEKISSNPDTIKLAIPIKNWEKNVSQKYFEGPYQTINDDCTQSQTSDCYEYEFFHNEIKFSFIDTPGFNDTNGINRDNENLTKIIKAILKEEYLNGIVLVINGTNSRFNASLRSFMSLLKGFLPQAFIDNTIIVFTNCTMESKNFDIKLLDGVINYKQVFAMQNTMFRWDKTKMSQKNCNSYKFSWEDSQSTLAKIIDCLSSMEQISTRTFKMTQEIAKQIDSDVKKQIQQIVSLLETLNEIETKKKVIEAAIETMKQNEEHEKSHKVKVIPFSMNGTITNENKKKTQKRDEKKKMKTEAMDKENINKNVDFDSSSSSNSESNAENDKNNEKLNKGKNKRKEKRKSDRSNSSSSSKGRKIKEVEFNMVLPDNSAIHQYNHANVEKEEAEQELNKLNQQSIKIEEKIDKSICDLENNLKELRSICPGFNIAESTKDSMQIFYKMVNATENKKFHSYFKHVVSLICETK